jgi:hypothetical protein
MPIIRNVRGMMDSVKDPIGIESEGGSIYRIKSKAIQERTLTSKSRIGLFLPTFTSAVFLFFRKGMFIPSSVAKGLYFIVYNSV